MMLKQQCLVRSSVLIPFSLSSILFATILALFLVVAPNRSLAAEYVIGTDPWPPFTIMEKGVPSGIDVDFLKEIEKRLPDVTFRFEEIPWVRALHYMETGKIDAITGLAKRPDREKYITYTSPPYYSDCSSRFYMRKGLGQYIKQYEDLYDFEVGYVVNSAYFDPFDTDEKLNKYSVTHEEQLLKMLGNGRLDVIIGTNCQVDYDIKLSGLLGRFEQAEYRPGNNVHLYLGLSKKSAITEILPQLNQVIQQLKDEGVIDKIAEKYFK